MTAAVGFPTLRLIRISLGSNADKLDLTGLEPGQWRELTAKETNRLLGFK